MNAFIYVDSHSILVVSERSGLFRLTCPFLVVRLYMSEDEYVLGEFALVTQVRESATEKLEYLINGKYYPYYIYIVPKDE